MGIRPEEVHTLATVHRQLAEFGEFGNWRYRRDQVDRLSRHPGLYRHHFPEKVYTLADVEAVLNAHCGGMTLAKLATMLEAVDPAEEIVDEDTPRALALMRESIEQQQAALHKMQDAYETLSK